MAWLSYLQANKGQGDTLLPEVLQEFAKPHNHSVVYAADVRALQDRRACWGCWETGQESVRGQAEHVALQPGQW